MSHLHRQTRPDAREVVVVAVYEKTAGYLLPGDVVDVTRNAKNGLGLVFI
jgi:Flp pilus assembly protein CpaB